MTCEINGTYSNKTIQVKDNIELILRWLSFTEFIGIVILNSLVITVLFFRKRNSRMSFFVRNLAISDLSVGMVYLLPDLVIYYFQNGFSSKASCYVYMYVRNIPIYASTFAIILLTLDRLYVVTRPIQSATSSTKYKIIPLAISWLLAVVFCIPYFVVSTFNDHTDQCYYNLNSTWIKVSFAYDCLVNIIFPLSIIGVCYTAIVLTLCRKQQKTVMKDVVQNNNNHRCDQKRSFRERSNFFAKAKTRSIKLLFVVIIAYAVCWTPATIGHALITWGVIEYGVVYRILHVLGPLNSIVNPLVFLVFNSDLLHLKLSFKNNNLLKTRSTSYQMYPTANNALALRRENNTEHKQSPPLNS